MKLGYQGGTDTLHIVAPFAGAWIEIESMDNDTLMHAVAPFAGAWIEIHSCLHGRKYDTVAPFAGAWIEITQMKRLKTNQ